VCSPARAEAELEALLSTDLLADWADQHLIWEPDAMPLRVGTATGNTANPDTFLFPSYLRFVEAQGRNTRPLSLKVFRSKLIDMLRDTLKLPLPPDSSDAYRMRSLGSVVPCLRWRSDGLQDGQANGVIRSAFLARLKTQQGTDGTDAERIGNGKTPVGNGWNGWNGSSPYSPIEEPASEPSYRGSSAPQPVPTVPSVPCKGSCRSASVPDPFPSVPQGVPIEVQDQTGTWEPGWRQLTTGSGSGSLLCSDPQGRSRQVERKRIRPALNPEAAA
jgi:hypothetical protein